MNRIFDMIRNLLPPTHMNPHKAVTEQVLYNSSGNKDSDMKLDDEHFQLTIENDKESTSELEKEKTLLWQMI